MGKTEYDGKFNTRWHCSQCRSKREFSPTCKKQFFSPVSGAILSELTRQNQNLIRPRRAPAPGSSAMRITISDLGLASHTKSKIVYRLIFQGCSKALIEFVEEHIIYLVAVAGGVVAIQLIGMFFSICLCCALRRIEDFKA